MQTFLPHPDFRDSLRVLDNKRLGKQRVEAYQILSAITSRPKLDGTPYKGWLTHPCTVMWRPYVNALKLYYNVSIEEWVGRGFKNTMVKEFIDGEIVLPYWMGFEPFHSSHRSNLKSKDSFYERYLWSETPGDPYIWLDSNNRWYLQKTGDKTRQWLNTF